MTRTISLQLFTTFTTLVLARILVPADFGAVAAALVIVGMFDVLTQAGLGTNLVRRAELDDRETSTVFWMALGLGIVVGGIAAALSSPLTRLIGQPENAPLVAALAGTIPLSLTRKVGRSLLLRDFRFRALALAEMGSLLLYSFVAILLALGGLGAWAIILGYVIRRTFEAVVLFVVLRWRPKAVFDSSYVREEVAFSGGVLGQRVLDYLSKNIDYWVIGSLLGPAALGAYYVAFVIPELIRRRLNDVAREVLYPVLARIADDVERAQSVYVRIVKMIAFLSIPAMVGIAMLSDLVVEVAFGDQWTNAAAPMTVLALASAVTSITVPSAVVATAAGRPHMSLPAQVPGVIVLTSCLMLTASSRDIAVMAWSVLAASVVTSIGFHLITRRLIRLELKHLFHELLPIIVSTAAMSVVLWLLTPEVASRVPQMAAAAILVVSGGLTYMAVLWLFFRNDLLVQFRSVKSVLFHVD